jgi:hypothetical protein
MVNVMNLYLDDSGTRHYNRRVGTLPAHGCDWFSLGGVLIKQEDEQQTREHHSRFMTSWGLHPKENPLHSVDIRAKSGDFTFLGGLSVESSNRFMTELSELMVDPPFLGFACVIDRPGYDARYRMKYGPDRWSLCKTAFSVLVERAAKHARKHGFKLRVFVERSDRIVDGWMKGYYEHLRYNGMPFDSGNMQKYGPLSAAEMKDTLYEFRTKGKTSPIMQVADLYLWPMSIGGYHRSNRPYSMLKDAGKIVDCHLSIDEVPSMGVKYSCWESVTVR